MSASLLQRDKAGTPGLKSSTPTPRGDSTPGPSSTPGIRPSLSKPPTLEMPHPPSKFCVDPYEQVMQLFLPQQMI